MRPRSSAIIRARCGSRAPSDRKASRLRRSTSLSVMARPVAVQRPPSRNASSFSGTGALTTATEISVKEPSRSRVELATQQVVGALQHGGRQTELVQGVGRLESKEAAACNHRSARLVDLDKRANRERVIRRAERERARGALTGDRGHMPRAADGQDPQGSSDAQDHTTHSAGSLQ
jgi:hypothetical protein